MPRLSGSTFHSRRPHRDLQQPFQTFRGLAVVVVDDGLPKVDGVWATTTIRPSCSSLAQLTGAWQALEGTEVENIPSVGNGAGQQALHSRLNLAIHPAGFKWDEGLVTGESPTIAELKLVAKLAADGRAQSRPSGVPSQQELI